ncbi:MAG: sporulation integral membrane protein YtvI [Oscillospiraceae bacterium]|nr:sporulation integral membrane protein YtvI [Oscillospiraceae bacterium]
MIAAIVYFAFKFVAGWILPFILAFCIVSVIHPLIKRIVKLLGVKQEVVSVIIMLLIYLIVGTLLFLLTVQAVFMIRSGLLLLPDYYRESIAPAFLTASEYMRSFMHGLPEGMRTQAEAIEEGLAETFQNFLLGLSQRGVDGLTTVTKGIPAFLLTFVFTIMLSFFLSMQYDKVITFIKTQLPPRAQKFLTDTKTIIGDTVFKYLKAALTMMIITFLELSIGLLVLGNRNAIAIAAGIAIFDMLPVFGTGTILIPWVIIELLGGNYPFAMGLLILYAVIVIVRSIMEPKIVGDKLGLNPIVSLMAIYFGFRVFGVLGMILMPITTQILLELHKKGSIKLFS